MTIYCHICEADGKKVRIAARMVCREFLEDPAFPFWGEEGKRWIVHDTVGLYGTRFVHFRTWYGGKSVHKVAIIRPKE